jgi:hypothetical protein
MSNSPPQQQTATPLFCYVTLVILFFLIKMCLKSVLHGHVVVETIAYHTALNQTNIMTQSKSTPTCMLRCKHKKKKSKECGDFFPSHPFISTSPHTLYTMSDNHDTVAVVMIQCTLFLLSPFGYFFPFVAPEGGAPLTYF